MRQLATTLFIALMTTACGDGDVGTDLHAQDASLDSRADTAQDVTIPNDTASDVIDPVDSSIADTPALDAPMPEDASTDPGPLDVPSGDSIAARCGAAGRYTVSDRVETRAGCGLVNDTIEISERAGDILWYEGGSSRGPCALDADCVCNDTGSRVGVTIDFPTSMMIVSISGIGTCSFTINRIDE